MMKINNLISRLSPRLQRLIRSSAFRLVMIYMLVFSISVAVLLVFIGVATTQEMENQVKYTVSIQLADLGRKFVIDGPAETRDAINHLIAKDVDGTSIYMLTDAGGEIITGNLRYWPRAADQPREWVKFPLGRDIMDLRKTSEALAASTTLPGGYGLLVGYNLGNMRRLRDTIDRVMLVSVGLTIALAAVGGAILTLMISRRLEAVNQACRSVMAGDLKQKAHVTGSGDEFDHLADNFNAMLDKIRELIDGVRDISNNVAHDLRTPLNRLRHRLEKLDQPDKPQAIRRQIRSAINEVDSLVATFNAILRISQAEMGAGFENFRDFSISETVADVAELYDAVAEEKQVSLKTSIEQGLEYRGDRHLLAQMLANVVDNAIKYSPSGSEVQLRLSHENDRIILEIKDNGPGIPSEFRDRVTEKFFRLENSRHTPGNGLGLSLAQAVVKLHGGEIHFADGNPGLKVEIALPLD